MMTSCIYKYLYIRTYKYEIVPSCHMEFVDILGYICKRKSSAKGEICALMYDSQTSPIQGSACFHPEPVGTGYSHYLGT